MTIYREGTYNAEFISWECSPEFTREKVPVDAADAAIAPGTVQVVEKPDGSLDVSVIVNLVPKGSAKRKETAVVRGPAKLQGSLLVYPEAAATPAVPGNAGANPPIVAVPARTAAENTALLKTEIDQVFADRLILLRD